MPKTEWNLPVTVELDNGVVLGVAHRAEYRHDAGEGPTLRLGAMKWHSGGPTGAGALAVTLSETIQANEQLARELDAITAERDDLNKQLAAARRSYIAGMTALSNQHERALSAERAEGRDEIEAAANDIRALKDERDELRARLDTAVGYDTEQADRVAAKIRTDAADMRKAFEHVAGEIGRTSTVFMDALRHGMGLPPTGGAGIARDTTNEETPVTATKQEVGFFDQWQQATITMPDGQTVDARVKLDGTVQDDMVRVDGRRDINGFTAQDRDDLAESLMQMGRGQTVPQVPDGKIDERLRTEIEELVLDYCGYVDGAELSAHGSADNDLAHERAGAAMAFLDYVRGANVLTGAFRITERERGGWHIMPLAGAPQDHFGDPRMWRVGASYGIHVYAVVPGGSDEPIGTMMHQEHARQVVADHNARL
jgi:hypothetical protein